VCIYITLLLELFVHLYNIAIGTIIAFIKHHYWNYYCIYITLLLELFVHLYNIAIGTICAFI